MTAVEATPILFARDAMESAAWYARLGFEIDFQHRFDEESPLFVGLRCGDARLLLSEHRDDAHPDGLLSIRVDDLADAATSLGARAELQEWGIVEVHASDPAGNRVRIGGVVPVDLHATR